ncbi:MAG: glycosyltransferase [PVC group bacterium]|nr:glycosyltransferase [PVC group bacterium]
MCIITEDTIDCEHFEGSNDMRIALVFPPYRHKIFSENLRVVDEEFCLAPPIILAYVAAILERAGHEVILLDIRALDISKEEALKQLKNFNPDMLGFRAESYHFHDALSWVSFFKQNLKIPVFTGGPNMGLYPRETMSHPEIDYGIIGEAIVTLPKLIRALENQNSLVDIPGIVYKDIKGIVIINIAVTELADIDSYPFPARHLLPNDKYYSFISQRKNYTVMLTSAGCPFTCTFCAIPRVHRVRSPQNVLAEIDMCCREFNIREIDFFDAVLFTPRQRILEICDGIISRKLDLEWSCRSRVDIVDEEILSRAAKAGCRQIYYGIESTSPDVLKAVNKQIDPKKVKQAIKWSRKYGIRTMGFFMVGNKGDTINTVRETIRFAKDLKLDFIQVCRTIGKPGTSLDKEMILAKGIDQWGEHILGNEIKGRLSAPWSGLTNQEKTGLMREFYLKFYFRPSIILKMLLRLKSWGEFKRYCRTGLKFILQKQLPTVSEAQTFLKQNRDKISQARTEKVAVVIPTYNEKDNIKVVTAAIKEILPEAAIIIVDDNSLDGTGIIADELAQDNSNIYVIHRPGKQGLGAAYKDGFSFVLQNLDSEYIVEMDADCSHDPAYLPELIHNAKSYDLVTGSRFYQNASVGDQRLWRNFITKTTRVLVNIFTDIKLTDVTTGYKCFSRPILAKIDWGEIESESYAFQIEVSYVLKIMGARIKEIPIRFVERSRGESKISLKDLLEGMYLLFRLIFKRKRYSNQVEKVM